MPRQNRAFVLPFRIRSDAAGSIYVPAAAPEQPTHQPKSQRRSSMSRSLSQRLYGFFTVVAVFGLLSPFVMASVTFSGVPH